MKMAKTSVVVTSYNGERFLGEQLRSILGQSQPPDEIVLGDDASTDASLSVARAALAPFVGHLQILTTSTRAGVTANLTRCLESSTGDVVAFADQDDVWRPDKLAKITSVLRDSPEVDLVFSDGRLIDEHGRQAGRNLWAEVGFGKTDQRLWPTDPIRVLTRRTVVTGATMAARRSLVEAALPLPTTCWHDEWFALTAVLRGTVPVPMVDTLIDYRLHGNNTAGLPSSRLRDRLVQAGWPRDTRIDTWQTACERFGPSDSCAHLQGAMALAQKRPGPNASLLERARQVTALGCGGGYRRYGQGWRMALHDLIAPALYGRK